MRGVAFMGENEEEKDERMANQNFCARYFALSWKLLTGELSNQLRWLSRMTASTSMARACAIWLSKSILPVPSSMQRLGSRMKLWHINDRGTRITGSAITPILKTDSMELGTHTL